jgi:hypothetical protein
VYAKALKSEAEQTKAGGAAAGVFLFCAEAQLKVNPPKSKKKNNQNGLRLGAN